MSVYEAIISLLGAVPAGYEGLAYAICGVILLFLVSQVMMILSSLVSFIGGK